MTQRKPTSIHAPIHAPIHALALLLCAASAPVSAGDLRVASRVPGVHIVAAATLPPPRHPQILGDGACGDVAIAPKTAAGHAAADLGWYVTSEVQAAGYTSIGIFSRAESQPSNTCIILDGNIAVYRGAQLRAIVYGDPPTQNSSTVVGGAEATPDPARVRIGDWTPIDGQAGDIVLADDAVTVAPLPARETYCGNAVVPNLRGKTVPQARALLAPLGWTPAVFHGDNDADLATQYRKQGLTEFESCSGVEYGFCAVEYRRTDGTRLRVTTIDQGDDPPAIAFYDVACPGQRR